VLVRRVFRLILPTAVFLVSCSPQAPVAPVPALSAAEVFDVPGIPVDTTRSASDPIPEDTIGWKPANRLWMVQKTCSGIPITAVTFDSRTHRLVIADQPGGPGSRWPDAAAAARDLGGIAAVNGGFFTPEGQPLGLVVSGGKKAGSLNRASSLGAGLFVGGSSPTLLRRERGSSAPDILQSGPFLVEDGSVVSGLSQDSSTARTVIGWDGAYGWFIARTGACSLADLGQALAGSQAMIGGMSGHTVLNLDGGRSSDLWVSSEIPGGPVSQRPFWNKPVRNFLVLIPHP
jgi:hypothetical protein